MSKLEELIAELCPDGVEYRMLYEIADLTMGTSPSGSTISTDPSGGIEFHQGKTFFGNMMLGHSNMCTSAPVKEAEAGSIIMSVRAPVGDTNITDRKIAIGRGLCGILGKEALETKFLYYYLNACVNDIKKKSTGSTFQAINTNDVKSISIPLPPLPVQREIVRILDNFTELAAELAARKKQYEFYRNKLLTFGNDVPIVALGDVCQSTNTIRWKTASGDFHYIDLTSVDRATNEISPALIINAENAPSRAQQIIKTDDVLFATTRPTLQRYCIIPSEYNGQICSTGFCVLRPDNQNILPKFLFYTITTNKFNLYVEKNQEGTSYPSISDSKVKKYPIHLPPLEEQARIVAILDRFDALCNDLSSGLPAEIEARRKQYEYYRDRLLAFREKTP